MGLESLYLLPMTLRGMLLFGFPLALLAQEGPVTPPVQSTLQLTSGAATPPPVNKQVLVRVVFMKQDENGKRNEILSSPSVTVASGAEARVQVAGKPDASGKVTDSVDLTLSPTVGADGVVALNFHSALNLKGPDPKPEEKTDGKAGDGSERKRFKGGWNRDDSMSQASREGMPVFHSFSPSDGLFSLEDKMGNRKWTKIGQTFDGWVLESFNLERQRLVISQGKFRTELPLYKAVVEASATEISTTLSLHSGETTHISGVNGVEVAVSVRVL